MVFAFNIYRARIIIFIQRGADTSPPSVNDWRINNTNTHEGLSLRRDMIQLHLIHFLYSLITAERKYQSQDVHHL
ncbi:hypothetical protein BABINDRAFT_162597 [Babjeviella inositovora NRRL Y-12698]|uniref:Uncharacterized protein n=1 Tax=Babjeviella inositovora NRRL Y-12698 TaxID=984486 RepID=A0A1E3QKZ7_9ASCO|nr:uncharacterized protein BABINDRAFT_162597 [Babjeviella inositovora NRRL Y-12698]ODQ78355.1 hypothetical protein BABINDRAFT_162597 [Babjeviella inositovora NRRL Y-12698]